MTAEQKKVNFLNLTEMKDWAIMFQHADQRCLENPECLTNSAIIFRYQRTVEKT